MMKKTITYTDYNGIEKTEDFYFNLDMAELTELELSVGGGLSGHLQKITAANDVAEVIQVFKKILLMSYGQKEADGSFSKSEELTKKFTQKAAYSKIFMDLATNPESGADFVMGLFPKDVMDQIGIEKMTDLRNTLPSRAEQ